MAALLEFLSGDRQSYALLIAYALLVRILTGLSSYSGANDPPKYGDYEAQRHWMELAVNLPVREWYRNSAFNNASYWPLDYPPLSGYQSWLCGQALLASEPDAVALVKSHGYETPSSKLIMRLTVLAFDLLVFIPACVAAVNAVYRGAGVRARMFALTALLLQPAAVLIDHGHFQYNNISLGCTLAAVAAIVSGRQLLGACLFCLSLNHKQMSLFHAPAFFAHLLGWALQHKGLANKVVAVAKLGLVVVATFAVCWAPFLTTVDDALAVVHRIFPVKRGLYEDYVANVWCTTSLLIKWKARFAQPLLLKAAAGATLAAAAPAMLQQILRPSSRGLLLCLANSGFAFYMFSYQVHEKSILLPLLPITLLAGYEPSLAAWLPIVACFSMYPLLRRDGQALPYLALCAAYGALVAGTVGPMSREGQVAAERAYGKERRGVLARLWLGLGSVFVRHQGACAALSCIAAVGMHVARWVLEPPARLPWLHDRLCITFAFAHFAVMFAYLQCRQWLQGDAKGTKAGKKAD